MLELNPKKDLAPATAAASVIAIRIVVKNPPRPAPSAVVIDAAGIRQDVKEPAVAADT
jgi:hypothetical protein